MGDAEKPPAPGSVKDMSPEMLQGQFETRSSYAPESSNFTTPRRLPAATMPSPFFLQRMGAYMEQPSFGHSPLPSVQQPPYNDPVYVGMPQNFVSDWKNSSSGVVPTPPSEWYRQNMLDRASGDQASPIEAHGRAPTMYAYKQTPAHASFTRAITPLRPSTPENVVNDTAARSPVPPEALLRDVVPVVLKDGT